MDVGGTGAGWDVTTGGQWSAGGWGSCSTCCGGGTKHRSVTCNHDTCVGSKPSSSTSCNTQSCPGWSTGSWGSCSQSCGGGTQSRRVWCSGSCGCSGSRPSSSRSCNTHSCCVSNVGSSCVISEFSCNCDQVCTNWFIQCNAYLPAFRGGGCDHTQSTFECSDWKTECDTCTNSGTVSCSGSCN